MTVPDSFMGSGRERAQAEWFVSYFTCKKQIFGCGSGSVTPWGVTDPFFLKARLLLCSLIVNPFVESNPSRCHSILLINLIGGFIL